MAKRTTGSLPTPPTSFVGRESDQRRLSDLLLRPDVRLVTLTGPGGVGKTRLAIQVAEAIRTAFDDALFVDLTPLTDASLVPQTVAGGLGIKRLDETRGVERMARVLRHRNVLLLVDNFEHMIEAAPLIGDLLRAATDLKILVTSREPLRLSMERVYPVSPLGVAVSTSRPDVMLASESVRLFLERAEAANSGFSVTEGGVSKLAGICARLDGLPLAIELAAARVAHLTPQTLLDRLERSLPLLTGGARDTPERQRTLRDTIAWSYALLPAREQRLFRRLGAFRGGFTLDAAEFAATEPGEPDIDVVEGIGALVAKNLIRIEQASGDLPRFGMLETIREFALEQLTASEERLQVQGRHAAYFQRLMPEERGGLNDADATRVHLERIEAEHANFRLALLHFAEIGDVDAELWLANELDDLWFVRGWLREGIVVLKDALGRGEAAHVAARAHALSGLAFLCSEAGDFDGALKYSAASVQLARVADDPRLLLHALVTRGIALRGVERFEEALVAIEEAVSASRALPTNPMGATAVMNLGAVLWDLGDCDRGKALVEEGIAMTRLLHYDFVTALGLARMGRISQVEGDRALAAQCYGESLKMWWSSGSAVYYDRSLVGLAGLAVDTGRANVAARLLGAVEAIQEGTGALSLMWPEERDRAAVSARAALGEGEYLREFAAGREIDAEAVKVEALALVDALSASATDVNSETGRVPFGLSGRELEVLRLLAGGQSDRQIGETLFCSHRTVNSHVAHIYQKLGVNSRAEATLVAQRAGLLAD